MARKAEVANPLTGRKFRYYHAAHVQWSASSQIIAEKMMSTASRVLDESKEYKSKQIVESMIASKEPDHSLGATPIGSAGRALDER
jgi:hypothetical protein